MLRDFTIKDGIYLVKESHTLDLHNNFDFQELRYSVVDRRLSLHWHRSSGEWVPSSTPAAVTIECRGVIELRFLPRDPELPFTEDDCVNSIGYWTDEDWANGVVQSEPSRVPESKWPMAIEFMSGAVVVVQAESSHASIRIDAPGPPGAPH